MTTKALLAAGSRFDKQFEIVRLLGEGGMGAVYLAKRGKFDQRVALKTLRPDLARKPDQRARFDREAAAASRLQTRHVPRVFDVGEDPHGVPYLVLEYLDGVDLARMLDAGGPLGIADAARWIGQACEALTEAHALGIVHRDLKPANLFLTNTGDGSREIRVLDFGLAKTKNSRLTQPAVVMGTPDYISPEQLRSAKVDGRADVWALGVTLFELLTHEMPFGGESPSAKLYAVAHAPALRVTARRGVPKELADVVAWCLEKDVEHRCPNVIELGVALAPFYGADPKEVRAKLEYLREQARLGRARAGRSAENERAERAVTRSERVARRSGSWPRYAIGAVALVVALVAAVDIGRGVMWRHAARPSASQVR